MYIGLSAKIKKFLFKAILVALNSNGRRQLYLLSLLQSLTFSLHLKILRVIIKNEKEDLEV
jgi:hypothetical protein